MATTEPSVRERVLQGIFDTFIDGGQVTVTATAARSGVSRQRIHSSGLRPLIAQFATAQRELVDGNSHLAASRISALRAEVELLRHTVIPNAAVIVRDGNEELVDHLRIQVRTLETEVARLQDEIVAERSAVALILGEHE
ncbi:MAG: hypothetical protein H7226_03340 [Salinibacterium sp.]|nr:hypothetical protein [Salinibacterium sp.]